MELLSVLALNHDSYLVSGSERYTKSLWWISHEVSPWVVMCFDLQLASLLTLTLWSSLVATPSLQDVVSTCLIHDMWGPLMGVVFGNGVTISTLWCHDETEGLLWARTQGCVARHAQVSRIASHDPLWSYPDVLSFYELFLGYLSLSCQKILILNQDVSFI
jgi:hypothetical protein